MDCGFKWPAVGETVAASDWNDRPECGGGLHGWPWGFGVGEGRDICDIMHWQVCAAKPEDVVGNLEGGCKCKFRAGMLIFEGEMAGAFFLVRAGLEDFIRACAKAETPESSSSGYSAQLASSGDSAQLASSGDSAQLASSGKDALVMSTNSTSTVTVGEFGCFAIGWKDADGHPRISVGRVGVKGIKAGVRYTVNNLGKIVKV